MTAFMLQTALLLLVAYFAGAFLGCLVRRSFFAHTLEPAAATSGKEITVSVPAPVTVGPAAPVTRFERALTGAGTAAPPPATPQPPPAVSPVPQAATAKAAAPAPVAPPAAAAPAASGPHPGVASATAAAVSAVAAAAAARAQSPANLPTAMGTSGPATVTAPIAAPPPAATPPAPVAPAIAPAAQAPVAAAPVASAGTNQDLTRIRAIDETMQRQLAALGVRTYADIAAWKPEDVARIAAALKVPGRIEQENWIEQAQILAKGGETYYSRRKQKGELPTARPTPDEGERITVRVPAMTRPADPLVTPAPAPVPVDLKAAAAAAAAAVQAAQAAVVPLVKPAAPAPVAQTPPPNEPKAAPVAPAPAALATAESVVPAAAPERPVGMHRDALQRIAGINGEVERLLNVQGVTRFAQIAGWSASEVARFDRLLGFEGRIARENWIEQAQILSKGGETAYSREMSRRNAEAPRPARLNEALQERAADKAPAEKQREDLSALRSVRSEAYRGPDAAAAAGPGSGRPSDDLKRIRGVGVLIEKKLNAMGVTRYDQVANWSAADIERFSEKLDFKGRIERENWVEQARILSAGGQTEFSQRVDRGEVETSKLRT